MKRPILLIKHGALGDFIFALGAIQAIRNYHSSTPLFLLTSPELQDFAKKTGYFDAILQDPRLSILTRPFKNLSLLHHLQKQNFERIYDLQRSNRTKWYFRILKYVFRNQSLWNGIQEGMTFFYPLKSKYDKHILTINAEQLSYAGIKKVPSPSFDWLRPEKKISLSKPYFLLVPGCSPTQLHKRWPLEKYGQIAQKLLKKGITPVLLGGPSEKELGHQLQAHAPGIRNLIGQTSLYDIPTLARAAEGSLGNDTGPMHIIYFSGCPSLFLFSYSSGPALCGPTDGISHVLQQSHLPDLEVETVWKNLRLKTRSKMLTT